MPMLGDAVFYACAHFISGMCKVSRGKSHELLHTSSALCLERQWEHPAVYSEVINPEASGRPFPTIHWAFLFLRGYTFCLKMKLLFCISFKRRLTQVLGAHFPLSKNLDPDSAFASLISKNHMVLSLSWPVAMCHHQAKVGSWQVSPLSSSQGLCVEQACCFQRLDSPTFLR